MKKKELIFDLIWSFNSGVDETVSESPRNWLSIPQNNDFVKNVKNPHFLSAEAARMDCQVFNDTTLVKIGAI